MLFSKRQYSNKLNLKVDYLYFFIYKDPNLWCDVIIRRWSWWWRKPRKWTKWVITMHWGTLPKTGSGWVAWAVAVAMRYFYQCIILYKYCLEGAAWHQPKFLDTFISPNCPDMSSFIIPSPSSNSSYWLKCIFPTVGANSTLTVESCNCKPSLTEQGSVGRCQLLKECLAWSASTHPHRASQLARTQICMQWSHFKAVGGTCVRFGFNAILLLLLLSIL